MSRATGRSPSDLAVNAGIAASTLTRVVKGKSRLSIPTIEKLTAAYPEAAAQLDGLFIFGENKGVAFLTRAEADEYRTANQIMGEYVNIPSVASLPGEDTGFYKFSVDDLRRRNSGSVKDFVFLNVRSDSMRKSGFHAGDRVLIDLRDNDPARPGVFAVRDGDIYALKTVERVTSRPGWLRIYTDFRTQGDEVRAGEIDIIGRPTWVAREL